MPPEKIVFDKHEKEEKAIDEVHLKIAKFKDVLSGSEKEFEDFFVLEELPLKVAKRVRQEYENMILDTDKFLGSGNNALVFNLSEDQKNCVKCRWNDLSVECRSKKYKEISEIASKLREIQEYFEDIKNKRRKYQQKGFEFLPQKSALVEAVLAHTANLILTRHNLERFVPRVNEFVNLEHEEEEGGKDPYIINENVSLIHMEQVDGYTLEEIILEYPVFAKKINAKKIISQIKEIFKILHDNGIFHGDLSLRNVMIDTNNLEPRIIDFGAGIFKPTDNLIERKKEEDDLENLYIYIEQFCLNPDDTRKKLQKRQNNL